MGKTYDAVVLAPACSGMDRLALLRAGQRVLLVDKYGPASARRQLRREKRG
jgi:hypothetical protein